MSTEHNITPTTNCQDTWDLDDPAPCDLGDIRQSLIVSSGLRHSIVDRGLRRLGDVRMSGDGVWQVVGRPDLGDTYPSYTVRLQGPIYDCTCHDHFHGESRQRSLCSHIVAVIVARRLGRVQVRPSKPRTGLRPADLGLPAKFGEFRDVQLLALERIQNSDKKFILLQAPTGSGKSLIAAAVPKLLNTRALYSCHTLQLQSQFVADFGRDRSGHPYACELKGRANYPTLRYPHLFPRINASMCTSKKEIHCRWCCAGDCNSDGIIDSSGKEVCFTKASCPYRVQKAKVFGAELVAVNTALFLNEANLVGGLSGWPWLVIDECDQLESALMSHVELEITRRWVDRLALEPPARKTVEEVWIEWAQNVALPAVTRELERIENEYGIEDMRRQEELERIKSKLDFFLREVTATKWVFLPGDGRWAFKPVFVSCYAEHHLWRHANRFILMSATIISPDEMAHSLGIPKGEVEFIDLPSTFPADRRPIYYLPKANITKTTEAEERPKAIAALDEILDKHPNDKVLVHTVSYGYAQQVYGTSRHKKRMITYDCAQSRGSKLEEFKGAPAGAVLVASSMDRGVDLPGNLCRVVVVLKVPYLNLGDKQIAARLYSDKKGGQLWYSVAAIRDLVQMCGRGMRSADDRCDIYILDSQFGRLYKEYHYLFPRWWRDAVHTPTGEGR